MPNKSSRINKTPHNDMNNILLILNSLDPRVDPEEHPKLFVIFNDVSKQYIFSDGKEELKKILAQNFMKKTHQGNSDYQERIKVYKNGLKEFLKEFYL